MATLTTYSARFIAHKGKPKSNGRVPILLRIIVNKEMAHFSTKYDIPVERWLTKEGRAVGSTKEEKYLNAYLGELQMLVRRRYDEMVLKGEMITASKLKESILVKPKEEESKVEQELTLLSLFDLFIDDYKKLAGKEVTMKTYQRYLTTKKRMGEFLNEIYNRPDISLPHINLKFITDFERYNKIERGGGNNYTMKFVQRFRTVFNLALNNGWVRSDPFAAYKFHFEKVDRGYLTQTEVNALQYKRLTLPRLSQIRDYFLFSIYTGLAYVDISSLTWDEILRQEDGSLWIETKRQKTKVPVRIKLLDQACEILNRYPQQNTTKGTRVFSIPSNQKVNAYLKELAEICGIEKELTYHLSRHTFATTITLANGVPIETVSRLLGHTDIRTTQIYARITDQKVSNDMDILAGKLNAKAAATRL